MKRNLNLRRARRQGIMMLEVLIAITFFAVATGLAVKIHQQGLDHDQARFEQVTARFQLENIAEKLTALTDESFADEAAMIAKAEGVTCEIETFDAETLRGTHVTLSNHAGGLRLTHHLWRLQEAD